MKAFAEHYVKNILATSKEVHPNFFSYNRGHVTYRLLYMGKSYDVIRYIAGHIHRMSNMCSQFQFHWYKTELAWVEVLVRSDQLIVQLPM